MGERGQRQAAERREATGSPMGPQAIRIADQPDAETRVMAAGRQAAERKFSEDTVRRGIAQLQREAEAVGRPISVEDARNQVLAMLSGAADTLDDLPDFR